MTVDQFWAHVERGPGCWLWTGPVDHRGYGRLTWLGQNWRLAHRVSLELAGRHPGRLCALHRCDTPLCVNPAHLFLGTRAENNADMVAKGRHARGDRSGSRLHPERLARGDRNGMRLHPESLRRGDEHWTRQRPELVVRGDRHHFRQRPESHPLGERVGSAKLTADAVVEIRRRVGAGESKAALARAFGVTDVLVGKVVRREIWRHVP